MTSNAVAYLNRKCQQLTDQAKIDTAALNRLRAERRAERALADDLAAALQEAREDMADWAAYASEYFTEKWNLAGDLAKCDAMLARYHEARK